MLRKGLALALLLSTVSAPLFAQNTLTDRNGEIMRGVRMIIGKWYYESDENNPPKATNVTTDVERWQEIKELGFNSVRVAWVDPWFADDDSRPDDDWSVDEAIPYFDTAVANATATGMNIIINYHNVAEYQNTQGFGSCLEFWAKLAPRYKDNDLVYFELNNEQAWDASTYKSAAFKDPMKVIYDTTRVLAPDRTIILFSFHSLALNILSIADDYDWVDWNHTAIGYHMYGWGNPPDEEAQLAYEEANFEALVYNENYRTICTEWFYSATSNNASYIRPYYGKTLSAEVLEAHGQSWMDWRNWDDTELTTQTDILIPDAQAKGYWWVSEGPEAYPDGVPHAIPGVIQVEDYDTGGNGVGYTDSDTTNQGGAYRNDGVDIYGTGDDGGGYAIGWVSPGESLSFSVEVDASGLYDFAFRLASAQTGGVIQVEIDDQIVIPQIQAINTGDWDTFDDVLAYGVELEQGAHTLKLVFSNGGFNINHVSISQSLSTGQPERKLMVDPNLPWDRQFSPWKGYNVLGQQH